jgi:hypothetical protein
MADDAPHTTPAPDGRHLVALTAGDGPPEPLPQAACAVALQMVVGLATEDVARSSRTGITDQSGELRIDRLPAMYVPCSLCRQAGIGDLGVP